MIWKRKSKAGRPAMRHFRVYLELPAIDKLIKELGKINMRKLAYGIAKALKDLEVSE